MNKIILGAGGHARVLIDCIIAGEGKSLIIGITDQNKDLLGSKIFGIPVIGDDQSVFDYSKGDIKLVNALGSVVNTDKRKLLFEKFKKMKYSFSSVIHPSAIISPEAALHEGVQIMAGAVIQPGCNLAGNVLINTKASIDHDCIIGNNVHIAPGAIVCGGVVIENDVLVGSGATIIQGIRIGANSLVGAGSLVLKDVKPGTRVYGVPAKVM